MASRVQIEVEAVATSREHAGVAMFHVKSAAFERWLYRRERGGWQSVLPPQDAEVETLGAIVADAFPELAR